jgi:hypothetical protein
LLVGSPGGGVLAVFYPDGLDHVAHALALAAIRRDDIDNARARGLETTDSPQMPDFSVLSKNRALLITG